VIIVSILLAFGIDAWWGERQERADEQEALAQLKSDFRANAAQLDTVRRYHQRALDAGYEILSLIQSGNLGILQNDSLRVAIAGWPDIVKDLNGDENQEQANTFERLRPFLMTRGAMFDALMAGGMFGRLEQRPVPEMAWILEDSLFLEMVSYRVIRLEEILTEVATVDRWIQRILQLIETS
jgi:hypothetical protein